jgi:hypothetical protein
MEVPSHGRVLEAMKVCPLLFSTAGWCCLGWIGLFAEDKTPAFPGVEGDGRYTTGGRGGKIVHVTNLSQSGPGSFADAVSEGNRIVVFDISGIIDLTAAREGKKAEKKAGGRISIAQPNITVAGQTAPGEGICIKGGTLHISAGNVIVRYLRSRRGWIREGDTGDGIEAKGETTGEAKTEGGQTSEAFGKRAKKKATRGKYIHEFANTANIVIDHCSTSWATDENLSCTHVDRSTVAWSIAAEGCDYANPKQTPPNHSEGSLWGSGVPDGRATMHHMLYAHNRLRNPRMTGGPSIPPVLTFYNNVVYDWSEYPTHTGSERIHLQWLNNFYKPGPNTPHDIAGLAFGFHGDPDAAIYAGGNVIEGHDANTRDNKLAIAWDPKKFKKATPDEKAKMIVAQPFIGLPSPLQSAPEAYEAVLDDVGATLPARDAVDLRIVNSVRGGNGKIIEKETDFPEDQRWPDYYSLPLPKDTDGDGIPDFWEYQFALNPGDAGDAAAISAGGYANIEHYFNNSDPTGANATIIFVSARVSRATPEKGQAGEWRISRTGDLSKAVEVPYTLGGDAISGEDFEALPGTVTIPSGQRNVKITLNPLKTAHDNRTVILNLPTEKTALKVGCPASSLVVIRKG